jgi:multidrug resistance efflux pump
MKGIPFHRRWVAAGLVALTIGGVAALVGLHPLGAESPHPVTGVEAAGAFGFGHVDVDGGVAALSVTTPGRVIKVAVHDKSAVRRGDVLLQVEDRLAQAGVHEAQAAVDAAVRRLAQAQQAVAAKEHKLAGQRAVLDATGRRLKAAELTRDRKCQQAQRDLVGLLDAQVAEEVVLELKAQRHAEQARLAELQLLDPQLEVQRAEAEVRAARARLEQALEAQSQCVLRAPADGTVLRLLVSAGDVIGSPRGEPAVRFWPADRELVIRAEIDQESAAGLREGAAVRVWDYYSSDGFTGTGRVRRVSDWFAPQRTVLDDPGRFKDARTLECIIGDLKYSGDGPQRTLRIGQRMRVEILRDGPTGRAAVQ